MVATARQSSCEEGRKREEDGASATRSRHSTQHKKTNDGKCLFLVGGICSIGCCRGQARIRRPKPDRSSISIVFSLSLGFFSLLMFRMCTYTKGLRRRIHKPHAYRRTTVYIYAYSSINPSFFLFYGTDSGDCVCPFSEEFLYANVSVTPIHLKYNPYRKPCLFMSTAESLCPLFRHALRTSAGIQIRKHQYRYQIPAQDTCFVIASLSLTSFAAWVSSLELAAGFAPPPVFGI